MIDMGNNANVVISPHVRTDPVSVCTPDRMVYIMQSVDRIEM